MSFNSNDTNNTIHLGNYEEYFILYMDNELTVGQKDMVDAFLLVHPDLQAEFEILMSTKLAAENISFNKESLLSDQMKLNTVDEALLLYIDNELTADKKKTLELELAFNQIYQAQHQLFLQTKLDTTETIRYPYKQELYHKSQKAIALPLWMRMVAAVVIIAGASVVYFTNKVTELHLPPTVPTAKSVQPSPKIPTGKQSKRPDAGSHQVVTGNEVSGKQKTLRVKSIRKTHQANDINIEPAKNDISNSLADVVITEAPKEKGITSIATDIHKEIVNKPDVTSVLPHRNTIVDTTEQPAGEDVANSNERKGSIKSFLRKATRMIERKTGIDPTNGEDELLIGAVAVKLK